MTSDGKSKSTSLASEERVLRKLDELLGEVRDANERLRIISKAIEHLRELLEQLSQAGWVYSVALIADGDTNVTLVLLVMDRLYVET